MQRGSLAAVCALVLGVYAYTAHSGFSTPGCLDPADTYYNLLVRGFRAGRLNLKKEAPPGLTQLANPYDPTASTSYPVLDMSYYKGKLYLYYGVTPAVTLFWPYVAITGHYLPQEHAVLVFCVVGFLVSVGLLCALWRRCFAEVGVAVVAAGVLALGLATCTPLLLARCDFYEVANSCGYALTLVALAAIWRALCQPSHRNRWLAAASLAWGLAVGARPNLLFGAVSLLVPVLQARRERQRVWTSLIAAIGPIALIGLGLMIYNALRFDNPFEFGQRYILAGDRPGTVPFFGLQYLWFHFRVYFLEPARWSGRFPFVQDIRVLPLPSGHGVVDSPFGILTNLPIVWLALAAPLAWRGRSAEMRSTLSGFLAAVAVVFGITALTLCLFFSASIRYEVEFLSPLMLLAVIGILSLERALACRPGPKRLVRCGWSLLLAFSVAFSLLAGVDRCIWADLSLGSALQAAGQLQKAIELYERTLRINPSCAEAPLIHYNLGVALMQQGRIEEAVMHYEQTLRSMPDNAEAHNNLGSALFQLGRIQEAVMHYEQALRIRPDYAEPHNNLGMVLARLGRSQEAINHWEQALRIKPDYAEPHFNLAVVSEKMGRTSEAIEHYKQGLKFRPGFTAASNALARLEARQ
jgi:Tfp pilus assembly protein PilF